MEFVTFYRESRFSILSSVISKLVNTVTPNVSRKSRRSKKNNDTVEFIVSIQLKFMQLLYFDNSRTGGT